MKVYSDATSLSARLLELFDAGEITLFAGAGVSARAGLPVWHKYLGMLAEVASKYEPLAGDFMRKRIASSLLLQAADIYTGCVEIPDGVRLYALAEPFRPSKYDPKKIVSLIKLPFDFVMTTNYDRSLHDACVSAQRINQTAELHDPTLKQAVYWKDFFIARVHGRAEVPQSIVLDSASYKALEDNAEYIDFLHRSFNHRSCLFVGFSFTDPAIESILSFIASEGVYPRPHYAIVPLSGKPLIEKMSKYNIEVLAYDDLDGHDLVWNAFGQAEEKLHEVGVKEHTPYPFETARRLLAVCYAEARMGSEGVALRYLVVQAIVLSALDSGINSFKSLVQELRRYLSVKPRDAETLVSDACAGLLEKKLCLRDGDAIVLAEELAPRLEASAVSSLVQGITNRLLVRYNYEAKEDIQVAISKIAEEVIVTRGFDLGAEFAGAERTGDLDVTGTIQKVVEKHLPGYWQDRKQAIIAAFLDLLRRPDPNEEKALAELGRFSFGIEVVLQAGRSTMYGLSLPEVVYLDANVLMPAITAGHPFSVAYGAAIEKLKHASQKGNRPTRVVVADVFLEETVKHRQRAIPIVKELNLENLEAIRRPVSYYGAEDINVFIAAYSTWITGRRPDANVSFATFLAEVAPYQTEAELRVHLEKSGIEIVSTKAADPEVAAYADATDRLLNAYEAVERGEKVVRGKALILKKHEARQLYILERDAAAGIRCVFVTADAELRRAVRKGEFRTLDNLLLSHRNLVQLVDLLVGLDVDPSALSRLMWTVKIVDDKSALKEYLINRALQFYDAAMLLKLNDLLDAHIHRALHSAKLEGVNLLAKHSEARVKTSRFLDRTEDSLFSALASEMKKEKQKGKD